MQIGIDNFDVNGNYYISEVNLYFGGGYRYAYERGCDHMTLIRNYLKGKTNTVQIGQYEDSIYMMKHNEVIVRKGK